jgi:hypothetical protein
MQIRFVDVFKVQVYWRVSTVLLWGALLVGVPLVLSLVGSLMFLIMGIIRVLMGSIS